MTEPAPATSEHRRVTDEPDPPAPLSVLDLELQALAYEAALRYGARQVPHPLVEFLRHAGG